MAKITVSVPDGEYCADKTHLDCIYASHEFGWHRCNIFSETLGALEDVNVNGERRRLRKKCAACLNAMQHDSGKGIIADDKAK